MRGRAAPPAADPSRKPTGPVTRRADGSRPRAGHSASVPAAPQAGCARSGSACEPPQISDPACPLTEYALFGRRCTLGDRARAMKFAILYNTAAYGTHPDAVIRVAQHAEACGFESFLVPEHLVLYP